MPAGPQYRAATRLARRGVPIAIELYRRWQRLTPEQRERYLKAARQYADRATGAVQRAGKRRRRRPH
jgi:GrpB-like predicted nucleotidyltransferase (UPF0157 family)